VIIDHLGDFPGLPPAMPALDNHLGDFLALRQTTYTYTYEQERKTESPGKIIVIHKKSFDEFVF
jgi:hypothetical protein